MTSQQKDKFIVEWFGECWHELETLYYGAHGTKRTETWWKSFHIEDAEKYTWYKTKLACVKCGKEEVTNPDLTTYSGFGWLWGKMRTTLPAASVLWRDFLIFLDDRDSMPAEFQVINLIDSPERFRYAVYEFLKGEK